MAGKAKKVIIICLIVCILVIGVLVVIFSGAGSKQVLRADSESIHGDVHTVSANSPRAMENARWKLELDEQTLAVRLTDKLDGSVYDSVQDYTAGNAMWKAFCRSGVSVDFYSGTSIVTTRVSTASGGADTKIEYFDDGFDADISFPDYEFSMQLQVRLNNDGMSVYVPGASIVEGEKYALGAVWLYPLFGSTYSGDEEGYMFIPEGVGAIIDLADNNGKYKSPYSKRIYGNNVGTDGNVANAYGEPVVIEPKEIRMPVFGMVYTAEKTGFLGVVTDGEYNAVLTAYPNGAVTPYNWVTAEFMVRDVYTRQTARTSGVPAFEPRGDIRSLGLTYIFVNGDEADYTGLAKRYREYLVNAGKLVKSEDEFLVKLDFLGADSEKWFLFDTLVPMTTVAQMDQILSDLADSGMEGMLPTYFGWQKDGVTRNRGTLNTGIEGRLGSTKELRELAEKLADRGTELVLTQELLLANSSRLYNTGTDIVKGVNQVIVEVPTWQKLFETMYYMTPARSLALMKAFDDRYGTGMKTSLQISGITDTLFSYYSSGDYYSRGDTAAQYRGLIASRDGMVGMTDPNEYLWDRMDRYYGMSLATSGYNFISAEVPFLPIVLRGYVPYWASYQNFEPNEREAFLKLLEYGAYPTFLVTYESPVKLRNTNSSYIYTSEYSVLKDRILEYDSEIGGILKKVEGVGIEKHRYIADQVVSTTYANGVEILINYSSADYAADGDVIPAQSYICREGGRE